MKNKILRYSFLIPLMLILVNAYGCKNDNNSYATNPPSSGGSTGSNEISIPGIAFTPASKTVAVGTTITWKNSSGSVHTVTSGVPNAPDGLFDSGNMSNGGTFSHTFNTAGTFKYFCAIHGAMMTGTIIVQ